MERIDYDVLASNNTIHSHAIVDTCFEVGMCMEEKHMHAHYEILFVYEGERILCIENKQIKIDKNHIALIPPYINHQTKDSEQKKYKRYLINFSKDFLERIMDYLSNDLLLVYTNRNIVMEVDDGESEFVKNIMHRMVQYKKMNGEKTEQMFLLQLCELLTFFSSKVSADKILKKEATIIERLVEYLEDNFMNEISLESLSKEFFMSKYEISRMFSKKTGINFTEYLARIRVDNAKKLLESTEMSIEKIAELTGFLSQASFWRVFKNKTGMSPTMYRKENEEK